ncbi:elongin-A-like isoform X2 [Hydractinia symbiolongicarpus]|uniref:elongin-A-like isoform X2 n=1 Tax=Hydractinia symbiolongicarpus TaxID=13093 RepID=UPI00254B6944|nr:elongin-A-like isoform X2 [Hydractinia symbiolongicarpus]
MNEAEVVEKNLCRIRSKFESGITEDKKIKYLKLLSKLTVTVALLKKTSIGKVVNTLRKEDGPVGDLSKKLIIKWKDVASSEKNNSISPAKEKIDKKHMKEHKNEHKSRLEKSQHKSSHPAIDNLSLNKTYPGTSSGFSVDNSLHNNVNDNDENLNDNNEDEGDNVGTSGMSFGDMLMMPATLNVKKKKKTSKLLTSKPGKLDMPTLPDIELPTINSEPIYRPISRPAPKEILKRKRENAPVLTDIVSRKTRSVMYTGKKQSTSGVVTSLFQQCMRVLTENVDMLYETGGVPYRLLKPMLLRCTPQQLERLEYYNPHFLEESDELWKMHCQREFKAFCTEDDPDDSWKMLYKQLCVDREQRLKKLSTKITAAQAAKLPERSVKLAYVAGAPKPSMQVMRKQKRYGTDNIAEKKKELRERMEKEQRNSAVVVPFTHVPRRDRCSAHPPSSLSSTNRFGSPQAKRKKEEIGSTGPSSFMPTKVKKPARKPMMSAALKLLKKQKGRMSSSIMRR